MPSLFARDIRKHDLLKRTGGLLQVAGFRMMTRGVEPGGTTSE
jgi:hypothetical protein